MRNSGMLSHTITGIGDGDVFDNSTALNASLVTDDQRAGLYIFGQNRHRSAYDHDGDGYSEIPKLHGQTIGFRSFLKQRLIRNLLLNITTWKNSAGEETY